MAPMDIIRVDEHGNAPMTANRVHRSLFMGSAPQTRTDVSGRYDVLVLCAEEWQPRGSNFPGVEVVHAPLDDNHWVPENELRIMRKASDLVARRLKDGRRVLVTCWQGRNRSGVVSALALVRLGAPPKVAIGLVRKARGETALSNETFVRIIEDGV